jgi:diadenosine tetraphosphate (Ap4A) HIT family hydrolase
VLVIPKGPYVSWDDFSARAPEALIAGFVRAVGKVARDLGLVEPGYRLLANVGNHGGQEVPHLHVHLFGGRRWDRCWHAEPFAMQQSGLVFLSDLSGETYER